METNVLRTRHCFILTSRARGMLIALCALKSTSIQIVSNSWVVTRPKKRCKDARPSSFPVVRTKQKTHDRQLVRVEHYECCILYYSMYVRGKATSRGVWRRMPSLWS